MRQIRSELSGTSSGTAGDRSGRRAWARRILAMLAAGSLGRGTARVLAAVQGDPPRFRGFDFAALASARVPSTDRFFLRTHLNYPRIDSAQWELVIDGLVARRTLLRLEQARNLPAVSRLVTFECAGNAPGGDMVSVAEWRGTPLRNVLEIAGVRSEAKEVVLYGGDYGLDEVENIPLQYARSIPVEKALSEETLLVWEMNGEPLRREHGFPVRVVVPGYFATSHVKWLTRIRLVDKPFKGFYMTKRYIGARRVPGSDRFEIWPETRLRLKSQITRPTNGEEISAAQIRITGISWTGEGQVTSVEVSCDDGRTWRAARFIDPPSHYGWMRWEYDWEVDADGRHAILCRAFDDRGGKQPVGPDSTLINRFGNNWYHRIEVAVRRP